MSFDGIGSEFALLYENLCESPNAHDLNFDKTAVLESLWKPMRTALSPTKYKVNFVKEELLKLHDMFHEKIEELVTVDVPLVDRYLIGCYRRDMYSEDSKGYASAKKIGNFFSVIFNFVECVVSREYPAASLVARQTFCIDCFNHIPELRRIHDIFHLENSYGMPLPFRGLIEAALGRLPDNSQLDNFILNFAAKKLESSILHNALEALFHRALVRHTQPADLLDPQPHTLERFESELELRFDSICQKRESADDLFLTRKSPSHLKWRGNLKKDYPLSTMVFFEVDGETKKILLQVLLDEPLPQESRSRKMGEKVDVNVYYTIAKITAKIIPEDQINEGLINPLYDDSKAKDFDLELPPIQELLVWVSTNRSRIPIRISLQNHHFGPPAAKTIIVSADGSFAIVERLKMILGDNLWEENMRAEAYQNLIIRMLSWFKSQERSPYLMKPKFYGLSTDDVLSATRGIGRAPFSIAALEKWAYKTARRDPILFKNYSFGAKLRENSSAKIIVEYALNTFSDEKYDLAYHIKKKHPNDPNVNALAIATREKILVRYREMKNNPNLKAHEKNMLQAAIIEHYKNSGAITLLLPMEPMKL